MRGLQTVKLVDCYPDKIGYENKWGKPASEKRIKFLREENNFSVDRMKKAAEHLKAASGARRKTLDQWF
ncbi:Flap structure-specific endonuclease [Methanosarcina siciliae C2J]|uniref:Flap structure-specific endonuclease n=1 Tax=Methanosarcina siciliae C2J TaxID=1434118 RepID=A0A0E3LC56_9EURY|nr:hypothetical protein [Methanosarcina siciliae]AKB34936.1 Flap structure-specific endonuclease [Methanosarcina siciliae C2J]